MIELAIGAAIAFALMAVEHVLCTKLKSPLWGGIIPLLLLVGTIWLFAGGILPLEQRYLFPFFILNSIFLGEWSTGRAKYQNQQQKEMQHMKAKDLS